ncbi:UNVERIFIED_CONTAM: hypothetical protein RMT77_017437 [Armadillidium vulgare]
MRIRMKSQSCVLLFILTICGSCLSSENGEEVLQIKSERGEEQKAIIKPISQERKAKVLFPTQPDENVFVFDTSLDFLNVDPQSLSFNDEFSGRQFIGGEQFFLTSLSNSIQSLTAAFSDISDSLRTISRKNSLQFSSSTLMMIINALREIAQAIESQPTTTAMATTTAGMPGMQ